MPMESQNSRNFPNVAYHMARVGCSNMCEVGIQQLQFQCAIIAMMTEKNWSMVPEPCPRWRLWAAERG